MIAGQRGVLKGLNLVGKSVNVSRVLQDKTVSNVSGKLEGTGTGISLRELFRWLRESQPSWLQLCPV